MWPRWPAGSANIHHHTMIYWKRKEIFGICSYLKLSNYICCHITLECRSKTPKLIGVSSWAAAAAAIFDLAITLLLAGCQESTLMILHVQVPTDKNTWEIPPTSFCKRVCNGLAYLRCVSERVNYIKLVWVGVVEPVIVLFVDGSMISINERRLTQTSNDNTVIPAPDTVCISSKYKEIMRHGPNVDHRSTISTSSFKVTCCHFYYHFWESI